MLINICNAKDISQQQGIVWLNIIMLRLRHSADSEINNWVAGHMKFTVSQETLANKQELCWCYLWGHKCYIHHFISASEAASAVSPFMDLWEHSFLERSSRNWISGWKMLGKQKHCRCRFGSYHCWGEGWDRKCGWRLWGKSNKFIHLQMPGEVRRIDGGWYSSLGTLENFRTAKISSGSRQLPPSKSAGPMWLYPCDFSREVRSKTLYEISWVLNIN